MIVVKIYLWGSYVGALIEDGNEIAFEYDKEFRDNGYSISPLNLPLREGAMVGTSAIRRQKSTKPKLELSVQKRSL